MKLIKKIQTKDDTVTINQFGEDDYSVEYDKADYSVRGTLDDIKEDYKNHTGKELLLK